jgi:UDP-3-O-[3-hydroxymyristoyl] N-acetylglucosamine deacetylase / 3-hydroxyacyl-[acyl-carrier-protein] dehydratase
MRRIPHRPPFLLIDRAEGFVAGKSLVGVKNVSINEPFFTGHWPGQPIMPGVLILEAVAQAAGILIGASIDNPHTKLAMIASIDRVKLRRRVVPGDQLRIEVQSQRIKRSSACIKGQAMIGESLAAEAEFRFVIIDADRASASVGGDCRS